MIICLWPWILYSINQKQNTFKWANVVMLLLTDISSFYWILQWALSSARQTKVDFILDTTKLKKYIFFIFLYFFYFRPFLYIFLSFFILAHFYEMKFFFRFQGNESPRTWSNWPRKQIFFFLFFFSKSLNVNIGFCCCLTNSKWKRDFIDFRHQKC